jgi:DNA replication and repair protein RecF
LSLFITLSAALHLRSLKLTHFKNYAARELAFSARLNCLTGLNGVGKTNVLDAIHYLCLTKSHRNLADRHLVQHGADFFRLEGLFERDETAEKVVAKFIVGQRKVIERNGAPCERLADHIGQFPVVMIAPDDIALVQEGSEERRRLLDATLSQLSPDYLQHLLRYNALLKQRNALLKTFGAERRFDAALLDVFDQQMLEPAAVIYAQRQAFVQHFQPAFQALYTELAQARETAALEYTTDLKQDNTTYPELLRDRRDRDRELERSTVGPHRDDLTLLLNGRAVKQFASQGQLKSFLLALRLAQYEMLRQHNQSSPILLLDDIFDKLDARRVEQLVQLLLDRNFGQLFITDTQRARIEPIVAGFSRDYHLIEVI